jgi:hypothetical protein
VTVSVGVGEAVGISVSVGAREVSVASTAL